VKYIFISCIKLVFSFIIKDLDFVELDPHEHSCSILEKSEKKIRLRRSWCRRENIIIVVLKMVCIHQPLKWLPCCAHNTASDHGGNCLNKWANISFSTNRIHVVSCCN